MADDPWFKEDLLQHVVEIRLTQFDAISITLPDDAGFDFMKGDELSAKTSTPTENSLSVGDAITNKYGGDAEVALVEVIFTEDNPVGPEIYGEWQWRLLQTVPVHFQVPSVQLIDEIDPNPYHAEDQVHIDVWINFWNGYFDTFYDQEVAANAAQLANFQSQFANELTRILHISDYSQGTMREPSNGWNALHSYSYNTNLTIHSSTFTYFTADIVTVSYAQKVPVATAGTDERHPQDSEGNVGFGLAVGLMPIVTTLVEGDVWVRSYRNRDVFLINRRKLDSQIDIVLSQQSALPGEASDGFITYYRGCSGTFTIGEERTVIFATVAETITRTVSFADEEGTVLASFDRTGLLPEA